MGVHKQSCVVNHSGANVGGRPFQLVTLELEAFCPLTLGEFRVVEYFLETSQGWFQRNLLETTQHGQKHLLSANLLRDCFFVDRHVQAKLVVLCNFLHH